jgi:hypothetical protein
VSDGDSTPNPNPTEDTSANAPAGGGASPRAPRPLVERIGMAGIAFVLGALFGTVAVASFSGGEPFLALMGAIGCAMTLWVGILTLVRG